MNELSARAQTFIVATIVAGGVVLAVQVPRVEVSTLWVTLAAALIAALAQIPAVVGPTPKSSYNLALVPYAFAAIALGLPEALLVMAVASIAEWMRHRYPWFIQTFNIAALALVFAAAQAAVGLVELALGGSQLASTVAIVVWIGVFIVVNHFMVGAAILLARGEHFRESGVLHALTLGIDASLLSLGAMAALVWQVNPYASLLVAVPAFVMYATLRVPALERQALTDPKTGLYNARYFSEALEKELERAQRNSTPLTVIVCDLDLLRNINNTYGHLAGDVVLIGVARLLQDRTRDYDVVARIGGEEFAIIMPDTSVDDAMHRVEKLREAVESSEYEVETSAHPIRATMSFGVAERIPPGVNANEMLHNADLALYRAKLQGRNRVCVSSLQDLEDSPLLRPDQGVQ